MNDILKLEKLSVTYRDAQKGVPALKNVTFSVREKEIFGIVGESGSGKSTLGFSLLRLLPENAVREGTIRFLDKDISRLNQRDMRLLRGRQMGMIFQEPAASFNPVLSIEYQFRELLVYKRKLSDRTQIRQTMRFYLKEVGLTDCERVLTSYPHQLSGGQLQRVSIAYALALEPKMLIADEPTSSLDVTVESQIINLFLHIREKFDLTIIFITHNLDLVKVLCDRVAVLREGVLCEVTSREELFASPEAAYTRELLRVFNRLNK